MTGKVNYFKIFVSFFTLNFAALALGSLFTSPGINSVWFNSLEQAPWNPPGWMFGLAWTTIMICFTFYMTSLYSNSNRKIELLILFTAQWLLNVGWNIAFFHFQSPFWALIIISSLLIVLLIFMMSYLKKVKLMTLFIIPYIIWLMIATSLNIYILFKN